MSNAEQLVEAYLAIRAERERIKAEYEEQDKALKEDVTALEAAMLAVCSEVNADSLKTKHGTIMRKLNERYWATDWEEFSKFVIEYQAVELLERRIHQGNFKTFLAEHESDGLPPGVNVHREFGITVRKS
jgi:hypothetical protein